MLLLTHHRPRADPSSPAALLLTDLSHRNAPRPPALSQEGQHYPCAPGKGAAGGAAAWQPTAGAEHSDALKQALKCSGPQSTAASRAAVAAAAPVQLHVCFV